MSCTAVLELITISTVAYKSSERSRILYLLVKQLFTIVSMLGFKLSCLFDPFTSLSLFCSSCLSTLGIGGSSLIRKLLMFGKPVGVIGFRLRKLAR